MKFIIMILLSLCIASCTNKDTIYRAPDESQVQQLKPLTMPKNFKKLPSPK